MSKFLGAKSPATYYNIETGKVEPKIGQALRISKLLKEPVTNFLELKFNNNKHKGDKNK